MADAREITQTLRGEWHGHFGLCPGPAHSKTDRSLKIWDTDDGPKLHSFAGDAWDECRDWLKAQGLIEDRRDGAPAQRPHMPVTDCRAGATIEPDADQQAKQHLALEIWRASGPAAGSAVEVYLRQRGINCPVPPSLRYHPNLKHSPTGLFFPAMVAGCQDADRRVCAVHRTYLQPGGQGKANISVPKMALAPLHDGAVRLGCCSVGRRCSSSRAATA